MVDFIIDADPFIPTGVAATVEQVVALVIEGTLSAASVERLDPEQQPEDLKAAVLEAVAVRVADPATEDVLTDYTEVLADVGATKTEAADAVKGLALEEAADGGLV